MGIDPVDATGKLAGFAERWPNLWALLLVPPEYIDDLRFNLEPNSWSILLQSGVPCYRPKRTVAVEWLKIGDRQAWLQFWLVVPPGPTGKDAPDPTPDDAEAAREAVDEFMQLASKLGAVGGLLTLPYADSSGPAKRARLASDRRQLAAHWIGHVFAAEHDCETRDVVTMDGAALTVDTWRFPCGLGQASIAAWKVLAAGEAPKGKGNGKRTPQQGATVNARMIETIQKQPEAIGWNSRQWAAHLHCSRSAVVETPTWKNLAMDRERAKAERTKDRRRRARASEQRRD